MKKRITTQDVLDLETRITEGMTTAADVNFLQRLIEQIVHEVSTGQRRVLV